MSTDEASPLEQALAAEVRAQAARKGLSHKEIQASAGITDRSFRRYFVEASRSIPIATVVAVAEALGLTASELIRRAELSTGWEPELEEPVKRPVARRVAARSVAPQRRDG